MKREFVLALLLGVPVASFAQTSASPSPAPDNSKVNVRDRQPGATTADQQKNSKGDLEITRKVRQAIVKDKTLSTYAHNIKVVTEGGVVTLRGPVRSSAGSGRSRRAGYLQGCWWPWASTRIARSPRRT